MPEFIKMAEHRHFKAKISNSEMHVFDGIACFEIFLTTLIVNLISCHFEIIFNESIAIVHNRQETRASSLVKKYMAMWQYRHHQDRKLSCLCLHTTCITATSNVKRVRKRLWLNQNMIKKERQSNVICYMTTLWSQQTCFCAFYCP